MWIKGEEEILYPHVEKCYHNKEERKMKLEGTRQVHLMGTIIDLKINHPFPEPILDELVEDLKIDEKRFSANDSTSELAEVNKYAGIQPVIVHPQLLELIEIGKKESLRPETNLNIAIGPLVQTWRIGFDDAKVPTTEEIAAKKALTNPKDIQIDKEKGSVYLTKKGMKIDLGALAKGFFADLLVNKLKDYQATSGLLNLGGNLITFGPAEKREDKRWRIGIQDPKKKRGSYAKILKVNDKSVVTSGIYERSLHKNGKTYHHILNTSTGYPVETDVASITIVSDLSLDGEIWTTHLFGKTLTEIKKIMATQPTIDWLVINNQNETFCSKDFEEKYVI